MKYRGPIENAPPELQAAAEIIWGGQTPPAVWVEVDTENRPGWINVTAKIPDVARERIDAPFHRAA